jgi:hypothetical protein
MAGGAAGFRADPTRIHTAAEVLAALHGELATIRQEAAGADPGWETLGLLGELISPVYRGALEQMHHHLEVMDTAFGAHVTRLRTSAATYSAVEESHLQDLAKMTAALGGSSQSGLSVSVGGFQLLGFDPSSDIPSVSTWVKSFTSMVEEQDGAATAFAIDSVLVAVDEFAPVVALVADPFNFLITAGLGFLINLVKPLKDLLGLVTGNPDWIQQDIDRWNHVGDALAGLATAVSDAANQHLLGWQGAAAEAASDKLSHFVAGVTSTGDNAKNLAATLTVVQSLMTAAQQVIESLIATFLEWLFFTWSAALVAEVPTMGASTAAAAVASEAEAGVAVSRGVSIIDRVVILLEKLGAIVEKLGGNMTKLRTTFTAEAELSSAGAPAFKPLGNVLGAGQVEFRPLNIAVYGQIAADALGGALKTETGAPNAHPDTQIDQELAGGS